MSSWFNLKWKQVPPWSEHTGDEDVYIPVECEVNADGPDEAVNRVRDKHLRRQDWKDLSVWPMPDDAERCPEAHRANP